MSNIGVDIIELSRFKKIKNLHRVAEYFLTQKELAELAGRRDKIQFVASRFAAKEAVIKSLPVKVSPLDFQIEKEGNRPVVKFLGMRILTHKVNLSLSHSIDYVAGFASSD